MPTDPDTNAIPGRAHIVTDSPLPTPTHGVPNHHTLSFSILCGRVIPAAPADCLDVILDAKAYPEWNTFCHACTIDAQPDGISASGTAAVAGNGKRKGVVPGAGEPDYLQLGTKFTFDVHMDLWSPPGSSGRATALQVSVLEGVDEEDGRKGWRVAWRTRPSLALPEWMLRSERVQEFIEIAGPDGRPTTAYKCWETFYGVMAPMVRLAVGKKLERGFEAWGKDLAARVELRRSS